MLQTQVLGNKAVSALPFHLVARPCPRVFLITYYVPDTVVGASAYPLTFNPYSTLEVDICVFLGLFIYFFEGEELSCLEALWTCVQI